jgi:hypothetical protein
MLYVPLAVGWCRLVIGILYRCFLEARPTVQGDSVSFALGGCRTFLLYDSHYQKKYA